MGSCIQHIKEYNDVFSTYHVYGICIWVISWLYYLYSNLMLRDILFAMSSFLSLLSWDLEQVNEPAFYVQRPFSVLRMRIDLFDAAILGFKGDSHRSGKFLLHGCEHFSVCCLLLLLFGVLSVLLDFLYFNFFQLRWKMIERITNKRWS